MSNSVNLWFIAQIARTHKIYFCPQLNIVFFNVSDGRMSHTSIRWKSTSALIKIGGSTGPDEIASEYTFINQTLRVELC